MTTVRWSAIRALDFCSISHECELSLTLLIQLSAYTSVRKSLLLSRGLLTCKSLYSADLPSDVAKAWLQTWKWAAITVAVVTSPVIGKVAKVSFERFLGTIAGRLLPTHSDPTFVSTWQICLSYTCYRRHVSSLCSFIPHPVSSLGNDNSPRKLRVHLLSLALLCPSTVILSLIHLPISSTKIPKPKVISYFNSAWLQSLCMHRWRSRIWRGTLWARCHTRCR